MGGVAKGLRRHEVEADVVLDFGLARGIAYYSDLIFDLKRPGSDGVSLGGGGRYDGLARAMGGTELMQPWDSLGRWSAWWKP